VTKEACVDPVWATRCRGHNANTCGPLPEVEDLRAHKTLVQVSKEIDVLELKVDALDLLMNVVNDASPNDWLRVAYSDELGVQITITENPDINFQNVDVDILGPTPFGTFSNLFE